jgi:tetratricopeptide (TPR) repeat protein
VLLPPYFFELDNFLNNKVQPQNFSKMAANAEHIAAHAAKIAALPEYIEASGAAARLRAETSTDEDVQKIRTFVEHHADLVAATTAFDSTSPAKRLTRILSADRFVEFNELVIKDLQPDRLTYKSWSDGLNRRRKDRPEGSNRLDALAVALLKSANATLEPKRAKLRLVTRSPHMHAQMQEELRRGLWSESPLRHPRCFGVFIEDPEKHGVTTLRELLTSVEAFLNAATPALTDKTITPSDDDPVRKRLDDVKQDWRRAVELATIARVTQTPKAFSPDVKELVEIIEVINRDQRIRNVLRRLSRELFEEIPRSYQLLGLLVQGRGTEMRRMFEENIQGIATAQEDDALVLSSTRDNLPYRLEFYSDELRDWGKLFTGRRADWEAITKFFVQALEGETNDYEVLLALAYLLCATGNWAAAEKYCRLALQEQDASANPQEGLFLLAFSLRRQEPDLQRYKESLKTIDAAIETKRGRSRTPADARYLKEKATLLLIWWRRYRTSREAFSPPAISEPFAIEMLREAASHPDADDDLKAQIYNNLTMVVIDRDDEKSREAAREYLRQLKELRPVEGHIWRGSALIFDTIIWAGWKLVEYQDTVELRELVAKLQTVARSARGIAKEERVQIRDHCDQMLKSIPRAD